MIRVEQVFNENGELLAIEFTVGKTTHHAAIDQRCWPGIQRGKVPDAPYMDIERQVIFTSEETPAGVTWQTRNTH